MFSIYAYKELKEQLEQIDECDLFYKHQHLLKKKQKTKARILYSRLNRENSLYGTEFELKLRNEMNQKAIAKECAEWIKQKQL